MNKKMKKLYQKAATDPGSIKFKELKKLAEKSGFVLDHIEGGHHLYKRLDDPYGFMNFQPRKGDKKMAKIYQVRQLLKFIETNEL